MNQAFISFVSSFGLLLTAAIWGFGFVVVKDSLDYVGAFYLVALRYTLASLVMALVIFKRWKKFERRYIRHGFMTGCFLGLGYLTQTVGCAYTTAGKNAFLTTIYVILITFFTWIFFHHRPRLQVFIAALMSITGIGLLALGSGDRGGINKGDVFTLICGLFYALHIIFTERYNAKGDDTLLLTNIQFIIATLLAWLTAPFFDGKFSFSIFNDSKVLISVLYLGLFATMLCFCMQNLGLKYVKSSLASLFLSFESVFGVLFSTIFLHESLTLRMLAGCILIFAAVIIAQRK